MPAPTSPQPNPKPSRAPKATDDEIDDLPPLDGDGDDAEAPADDLEDDEANAMEGDAFDDATGEGDVLEELASLGLSVDADDSGDLDDDRESNALDVGSEIDAAYEDEASLSEGEEPGIGEEAFELDDDASTGAVDAGEEGPDAEDEELREEDLPRLDSDDDGDMEDGALGDLIGVDDTDDVLPAWDDRSWERVALGVDVGPVRAMATLSSATIVGGAGAVAIDANGRARALGVEGRIAAVGAYETTRAIATERGELFLSGNGGEAFRAANGWRELASTRDAEARIDVAVGANSVWVRTSSGRLVQTIDRGATWSVMLAADVAAITVDREGELVALHVDRDLVTLVRTTVGAIAQTRVPILDRAFRAGALASIVAIAARGDAIAIGVHGVGIVRSIGGSWTRLDATSRATALAFIDDEGTLLAALLAEDESKSWLVRAAVAASPRIVAQIGSELEERPVRGSAPDDETSAADPRVVAIAWDDAREEVKVAGDFGVLVFRRPVVPGNI